MCAFIAHFFWFNIDYSLDTYILAAKSQKGRKETIMVHFVRSENTYDIYEKRFLILKFSVKLLDFLVLSLDEF